MYIEVKVPDGISGDWAVQTFTVPKKGSVENIRLSFQGREALPGTYKRLVYKNEVVMSNTQAEILDFMYFVSRAKGHVLLNGLGLGVILAALLDKSDIESITVIEISKDVINLVAPSFTDPRVKIIEADAFTWKSPRGMFYNAVWHDIWTYISTENLKEINKLKMRYRHKSAYQEAWCHEQCKQEKRRWGFV